jgi:hypothetical protein
MKNKGRTRCHESKDDSNQGERSNLQLREAGYHEGLSIAPDQNRQPENIVNALFSAAPCKVRHPQACTGTRHSGSTGDASACACLRIRSRLCHVTDSDPCGCKSPALSIKINVFLDVRRHWGARQAAVKPSCSSSKWQPEQWRYRAWRVRCSAFGSRCMKCDSFPSTTRKKCSKTAFSLGVKWASVERGAAPCHRHWHQGPATRDLAGWTATQRASSSSEAKPQNQTKPP